MICLILGSSNAQCAHDPDKMMPGQGDIPMAIVSLPISHPYAVLVDKARQRLYLYRKTEGGIVRLSDMTCSTGEIPGAKERDGDKKTPEGVYFFTDRHPEKYLAPIYGSMAFPIDYPNILDRRQHKTGRAIWLHGTNRPMRERSSNGCVVLDNPQIEALSAYIQLNRTPIVIQDTVTYMSPEKAGVFQCQVDAFLKSWQESLCRKSYLSFLEHYDSDYLPDMSWWMPWQAVRERMWQSFGPVEMEMDDVTICRDANLIVAVFDQTLIIGGERTGSGRRKLFIQLAQDEMSIVGDTFQNIQSAETADREDVHPVLRAASALEIRLVGRQTISRMINAWMSAWSEMDLRRYRRFYANDFYSNGMNLDRWIRHKRALNARYEYIRVTYEDLKISDGDARRTATFIQNYESSGYSEVGVKRLELKRVGDEWKIYREISSMN